VKLKFYARGDKLVLYPGIQTPNGHSARYIGREFVPAILTDDRKKVLKPASNPASESPFECDSESAVGQRLARLVRVDAIDPPLYAADPETAAYCGVPFVKVSFADGAWSEEVAPAPSRSPKDK